MDQQKEVSALRGEVATLRKIQQNMNHANMEDVHFIAKSVDQSLLRSQVQLKQMVDAAISNRYVYLFLYDF